jgi:hypothetical protein
MKYHLSVLTFGLFICSVTAFAEGPQKVLIPPLPDRAAQAKADATDRDFIRAARIKAEAAEKADEGLPKSWDRDANGKRSWNR